jgi:mono/diheme cytochrome c family protein
VKTFAAFFALALAVLLEPGASLMAQDHVTNKGATNPAIEAGKRTYVHHCAVCHGADGRGHGPAAIALSTAPADLTRLAKDHGGKFPYEYVSGVVRFGKPIAAHGSSEMPVWGPLFAVQEGATEQRVRKIIKDLCEYLATLQEKES